MTVVGKLKGLELKKATNWHEGELVKIVLKEVILMLKKNYTTLPDDLVGMDHHVSEMEILLDVKYNGTRIIGILGMGGIGKTTISKVVFNRLCNNFDGCCFLDDVRERSKHHKGVMKLQNALVSKITKQELISISDAGEGIGKIEDVAHRKKVLIVLDDIDSISQFKQLLGDCLSFCQGSKIMVTTRNKDVLDTIEKTCHIYSALDYKCYEPLLMNDNHSLILFCKYAFKQESPPQEYDVLSEDVVSTASGLPLVLVTIGSLLFGVNDRNIWEEKVKKLKKIPNKDVLEKLKVSFDALEHEQQQIFLDIACIFVGGDKKIVSYMWDACEFYPESGLDTLIRRSLISVGDDDEMKMHDQLIDLGKQIVREENLKEAGERSRVWDLREAVDVLKGGSGSNKVEALQIEHGEHPLCFVRQDFNQLQNLRYLYLENVELNGDFWGLIPKLRILAWVSGGEFIPINLNLKNLVVLLLSIDKSMDKREGWSSLEASISEARKLKVLLLEGCNNIKKLSLSTFEDLEILDIENCNSLLEVAGLSKTKRLKKAVFCGCNLLTEIQGLEALNTLRITECDSLERLIGLSNLKELRNMHISHCKKLTGLDGLKNLIKLEILNITSCDSLGEVLVFSSLINLKNLSISETKCLREIGGLEELRSLESLCISCCSSLTKLSNLSHLTCLKHLSLRVCALKEVKCVGLVSLESLEVGGCGLHGNTLESLCILGCNSMRKLHLSYLSSLKHLSLSVCAILTEVDCSSLLSLEKLELSHCGLHGDTLESMRMSWCDSIIELPNLSRFTNLKELAAIECKKLVVEFKVLRLESLEILELSHYSSVGNTLDLSYSRHLKQLKVCHTRNLKEIIGLEELISLEVLYVSNCGSLEKLPDLSHLINLKKLEVYDCKNLLEVKCLRLVSLESLELIGSVGNTLDLSYLGHLKHLTCKSMNLREIRGLEELISLEELNISDCGSLEKLSDLSHLRNLKYLVVTKYEKLVEVKCFRLVSLESLKLIGSVGNTLDLSYLGHLKHLTCKSMNLREIRGLEELISLKELNISNCGSLEKLPDLSNLTNLRDLNLCGCEKLTEVKGLNSLFSLYNLNLGLCNSMEKTSMDFSGLINIRYLCMNGLNHLTEILGLEKLKLLRILDVSGCKLLEKLPYLSNLTSLWLLNIRGCVKLPKIEGLPSTLIGNNHRRQ